MRRKREPNIQVKCDYCGEQTEYFVSTAKYQNFCRIQTVGFPPDKDCMEDYIRSKNAKSLRKKNEEEQRLQTSQEQLQKNKKEKEKVIKKFDDYLFELKQKSRRQRASN